MTTQALSAKKSYFAPKFFVNSLKKSWTNFLLYFIICFFTCPVPILISLQSSYYTQKPEVKFEYIVSRVLRMLENLNMVSLLLAAAMAVFAGCVATRYLNSRTSAYFYHSLPITREALYFTRILTGFINYLAALSLSMGISSLVILIRIGASGEIAAALATMYAYSLLVFVLFFFVTVFIGMICGTTGVQFVMTGVALYIVPAIYLVALWFLGQATSYLDTDWYIENIMMYTSPGVRVFFLFDYALSALEIVLWILLAAVLAILSLLVYRRRKNEMAGNPIVFPKVASLLKYLIMIPATSALGIWFGEMGGGLWLIFGFAAGALLTFMLLNTIFNKNARAMFKGVRGLLIFCVVFALFYVGTVFDVLGVDEYIPGNNLVSRVELTVNGDYYGEYKDAEILDSLKCDLERIMKEKEKSDNDEYYYGYKESVIAVPTDPQVYDVNVSKDIVCDTNLSIHLVYYPKFGMPIAKSYVRVDKADFTSSLRAIADSDEFEKQYYEFLEYEPSEKYTPLDDVWLQIAKYSDRYYNLDETNSRSIIKAYKNDLGDITYETFQYPYTGYIFKRVRDGRSYSKTRFNFPIFMTSNNTLDLLLMGEDVYDLYLDAIHSVNVYRAVDTKYGIDKELSATFTDKNDIREILASTANVTDNYENCVFCEYDYRYYVEIRYYKDAQVVYDAEQMSEKDEKYSFDENWIGAVSYFIKDKVPAFVEAKLGE